MRPDSDVRHDVAAELRWSPQIDETDIAVKVNDGVVTLTGFVRNYFEKYHAEMIAKRIAGVAGVANDVQVRLPPTDALDDPHIARAAVAAIRANLPQVADDVKVLVHQGHITLEGRVEWNFQRERIEAIARHLRGVMGVITRSSSPARPARADQAHDRGRFRRNAEVDADHITVVATAARSRSPARCARGRNACRPSRPRGRRPA
jgi:osmotically-inducible protein OsmY